jgi:hypothetical protein
MDQPGIQGWKSQGSGGLSSHICPTSPERERVLMDVPGGSMTTISGGVRWARRV